MGRYVVELVRAMEEWREVAVEAPSSEEAMRVAEADPYGGVEVREGETCTAEWEARDVRSHEEAGASAAAGAGGLQSVLEAAELHGDESGRDHEAGDLAGLLAEAFGLLSAEAQLAFLAGDGVRAVLETGGGPDRAAEG